MDHNPNHAVSIAGERVSLGEAGAGRLIHGRLDLSSPVDAPWRIHQAWPVSKLIIIDDEGHGGETMAMYWRDALADLA